MTIEKITDTVVKRKHFMLSQHPDPPFQLFRWTVDTDADIEIIERYDPLEREWVEHDNDYIRDNFFGYKTDLTNITEPANADEVHELATVGWRARRFDDQLATVTET